MFWKRMFGDKPAPEQAKESGFFKKLVSGLEKTKQNLVSKVEQITSGRRVDESLFEELEEVLIEADCGVATAMFLVDQLRERAREEKITEAEELRRVLQEEMVALLEKNAAPPENARRETLRDYGCGCERCGQDHHHRQAGLPFSTGKCQGAAGRWRYL